MNTNEKAFSEWESDFYHFLSLPISGVNKHSRTNYFSWLKFLSSQYTINSSLSDRDIEIIIEEERKRQPLRDKYNKERDLVNFRSGLRKFKQFLDIGFKRSLEESVEQEVSKIKSDNTIGNTEREALIMARVGQGRFRQDLIQYWGGCAISKSGMLSCLIASHIKPWRDSTNEERLSVYNGLLLQPNYDILFDKGYISFDRKGKIIFSRLLLNEEKELFGVSDNVTLTKLEEKHRIFLRYHNEYCLMQ